MDDRQRVETLNKKEITTLNLICRGLTNLEIGVLLGRDVKSIGTRIRNINLKLDVEGNDIDKRINLIRRYSSIVRGYSDDDLNFWVPKEPLEYVDGIPVIAPVLDLEPEIEDTNEKENLFPLVLVGDIPIPEPIPAPGIKPRRRDGVVPIWFVRTVIVIFLAVTAVLSVTILYLLVSPPP